MVGRSAGLLALVALGALVTGCASTVGPGSLQFVRVGETTSVTGPGGMLVFGPTSVDKSVHVQLLAADPGGINLGDGCGLRDPVVLGAIRFEVTESAPIRDVRALADIPAAAAGGLLYVFHEPPQSGGFVSTGGYAVVSADGRVAEYGDVDQEGTWAFVRPGG